jgi:hypothetical protein
MAEHKIHKAAVSAFTQVRSAVSQLRKEYSDVISHISSLEAEIAIEQRKHVPVADMKAAILDFIDQSGEAYATRLRGTITRFATAKLDGNPPFTGKPLQFNEIEQVLGGYWGLNLRTQLMKEQVNVLDDHALYFLFGDLIKEKLSAVMERMSDAEFGYDKLHPDKIGTDRATRKNVIAEMRDRLAALHMRKRDLSKMLGDLGIGDGVEQATVVS